MDGDNRISEIGGLIAHAEALQTASQKAVVAQTKVTAAFREMLEQATELFNRHLDTLAAESQGLGKRAEQGGAAAVNQAIGKELAGLSDIFEKMTASALSPAIASLKAQAADALSAKASLAREAQKFSMRALGIIGGGVLGALVLIALTVWVSLGWYRSDVANLSDEKAALSKETEDMKANIARLAALGGKIEISDCKDTQGKIRKCVAVQPTAGIAGYWGTAEKPLYILKGY